MKIDEIRNKIQECSSQIEESFLSLADHFPALLTQKGTTAIETLRGMLDRLKTENEKSRAEEKDFFNNFGKRYNNLFDELNKKIEDLTVLNSQVKNIKEDSEELELITLNAMIISIKSGEKGRAFSCITENLKQLSNQMFLFSESLINEEQELLKSITALKDIFTGIIASQKLLANLGNNSAAGIITLIGNTSAPLSQIVQLAQSIYMPIQKTMEGLQMQDIIRQALEHIQICLKEYTQYNQDDEQPDNIVDTLCFNIELLKICKSILQDTVEALGKSTNVFDSNWKTVTDILHAIEQNRENYLKRFLDEKGTGPDNMFLRINEIIEKFSNLMQEFSHYHTVQKNLEYTCKNIADRAHTMYAVFEDLKPVIGNLQHVRILQQIEVAKNDAISSVRNSVTDMDNHIISAKKSLDTMQQTLQQFSSQTEQLLSRFTNQIGKDNSKIRELRTSKTDFFGELQSCQNSLSAMFHNFNVLPAGFEQECADVQRDLNKLENTGKLFSDIIVEINAEQKELEEQKKKQLAQKKISEWEIKNDRFKELIKHFTITAHKESAGKIGGFNVEKGYASGEITFF